MDRIRNLHVGQLVIIGIVTGILGLGFFVGGAIAYDALEQALRERGRLPEPGELDGMLLAPPSEEGRTSQIVETFLRLAEEEIRQMRTADIQDADRRIRRARTAVIALWGATPLLFLGYLGVLWIWFGGRREEGQHLPPSR